MFKVPAQEAWVFFTVLTGFSFSQAATKPVQRHAEIIRENLASGKQIGQPKHHARCWGIIVISEHIQRTGSIHATTVDKQRSL